MSNAHSARCIAGSVTMPDENLLLDHVIVTATKSVMKLKVNPMMQLEEIPPERVSEVLRWYVTDLCNKNSPMHKSADYLRDMAGWLASAATLIDKGVAIGITHKDVPNKDVPNEQGQV